MAPLSQASAVGPRVSLPPCADATAAKLQSVVMLMLDAASHCPTEVIYSSPVGILVPTSI